MVVFLIYKWKFIFINNTRVLVFITHWSLNFKSLEKQRIFHLKGIDFCSIKWKHCPKNRSKDFHKNKVQKFILYTENPIMIWICYIYIIFINFPLLLFVDLFQQLLLYWTYKKESVFVLQFLTKLLPFFNCFLQVFDVKPDFNPDNFRILFIFIKLNSGVSLERI